MLPRMVTPDEFITNLFKGSWQKNAKKVVKAAQRYLNYQQDRLSEESLQTISGLIAEVKSLVKQGDREKAEKTCEELDLACEKALPKYKPETEWEFQVVDVFVTIVVIFALRTFIFQPYRIPTGSMQPTLNGVKSEPLPKEEWPNFVQQVASYPLTGKAYMQKVASQDDVLIGVKDKMFLVFLNQTELLFESGKKMTVQAPLSQVLAAGLDKYIAKNQIPGRRGNEGLSQMGSAAVKVRKGDVLFSGVFEAGDTILVNKMEYHFRKPKLGEVFVFDTLGLNKLAKFSGEQAGGTNYIKRLCGLPGQRLEVADGRLKLDGKLAEGFGFERVMAKQPPYNSSGYISERRTQMKSGVFKGVSWEEFNERVPDETRQVYRLKDSDDFNLREYFAMGDNTENSLDSRYWDAVYQHNIVGPAGFAIWPITNGHFGFIK